MLAWLEAQARQSGALFVKIDPDIDASGPQGKALVAELQRRGWVFSAEQIQFRNTLLTDLSVGEEALLAGMKQKTRYNVRLAGRKGVAVVPSDDFEAFYRLYAETGARDGFLIRPRAYYLAVMSRMQSHGLGQLLMAEVAGEIIAGLFLFRFGPTAWYFYGASTERHRNLMPTYLLQWEAMRWAMAQGCRVYDWWGAPDVLAEEDPYVGRLPLQGGLWRPVHILDRRLGLYTPPGALSPLHAGHAAPAGLDAPPRAKVRCTASALPVRCTASRRTSAL